MGMCGQATNPIRGYLDYYPLNADAEQHSAKRPQASDWQNSKEAYYRGRTKPRHATPGTNQLTKKNAQWTRVPPPWKDAIQIMAPAIVPSPNAAKLVRAFFCLRVIAASGA
jgi:hypothetical protein